MMGASDDLWPRPPEGWIEPLELVEPIDGGRSGWVAPTIAALLVIGWIAGALWLARARLPVMDAVAGTQFVAALCVPPALVGIVWLLARRSSRAEARRFGVTAQAMRAEAAALEARVASLARTLTHHREQLVLQLDAGTAAAGRLEAIGQAMAAEIEEANTHARSLAEAATLARSTVGDLVASIPHAKVESEEIGRRIDQAGLTAAAQAAALEAQIVQLAARARDADSLAATAADHLAAQIDRMNATGEAAGARLERATGAAATALDTLVDRTEQAVNRACDTLAAQGDQTLLGLRGHQVALEVAAHDHADALATRLADLDLAAGRLADALAEQRLRGEDLVAGLHGGFADVEARLDTLHAQGVDRTQLLAASISALGGSADAMTEALRAGEAMAGRTIGTTETLLVALDAAAREIDETLPDALTRLDDRVTTSRRTIAHAKPELLALVTAAESTHDAIEAIADVLAGQRRTLDQLTSGLEAALADGRDKADALGITMEGAIDRAQRFADEAAPRLLNALAHVHETAQIAAAQARETLATVVPEAADALGEAATAALRRAASDTVTRQVTALVDATDAAAAASSRATERVATQVQSLLEQRSLLDSHMETAREEREAADSDSLARRVSLLIESLNSAAIDITKAFAPDVSDSAWAAYLKGDRGVFTRRAVRLLDGGDAREIARLYDDDGRFREQVNRYIHDFEGMLRQVLAQRDGSPLGVTLLSSDMGKLYVALAQAIERLR
ncbi:hypothetical protein [Sphingomonas rubra]|uniref:ATPase n=1 Tax=Sphingomonas rubra TaxID=634430 RepID=A0A1I5S0Q1_9SPHN|nr:hypothetical protein [Sphingomonas rubra]SFP64322.1 hypothetical protein SAMN04488241_104272 [Sphingomonas rubra]